jgi:proteasome activator subunit 4
MNWVSSMLCEGASASIMPYIPAVLTTVIEVPEMSEDPELHVLCKRCVGLMSQLRMPKTVCEAFIEELLAASRSPSWHARLRALHVLQVVSFTNLFVVPHARITAVLSDMLLDDCPEVRTLAGVTLSGFIRCGMGDDVGLRERFTAVCSTHLPKLKSAKTAALSEHEKKAISAKHAGLLGLQAFLAAYPYTVPAWMPDALLLISRAIADPDPIKSSVRKTIAEFRRTHLDNWQEIKEHFTEEQLTGITDVLVSPLHYA